MTNKEIRQYVHYAITLFVLTGAFLITNCALLKAYFLGIVIIVLHWMTNGNECCISKLDYEGDSEGYSNSIFQKFGISLSKAQTNILIYGLMFALIIYTYFKIKRTCGFTL